MINKAIISADIPWPSNENYPTKLMQTDKVANEFASYLVGCKDGGEEICGLLPFYLKNISDIFEEKDKKNIIDAKKMIKDGFDEFEEKPIVETINKIIDKGTLKNFRKLEKEEVDKFKNWTIAEISDRTNRTSFLKEPYAYTEETQEWEERKPWREEKGEGEIIVDISPIRTAPASRLVSDLEEEERISGKPYQGPLPLMSLGTSLTLLRDIYEVRHKAKTETNYDEKESTIKMTIESYYEISEEYQNNPIHHEKIWEGRGLTKIKGVTVKGETTQPYPILNPTILSGSLQTYLHEPLETFRIESNREIRKLKKEGKPIGSELYNWIEFGHKPKVEDQVEQKLKDFLTVENIIELITRPDNIESILKAEVKPIDILRDTQGLTNFTTTTTYEATFNMKKSPTGLIAKIRPKSTLFIKMSLTPVVRYKLSRGILGQEEKIISEQLIHGTQSAKRLAALSERAYGESTQETAQTAKIIREGEEFGAKHDLYFFMKEQYLHLKRIMDGF